MKLSHLDAQEQLQRAATWLSYHDQDFVCRLASPFDGLKLFIHGCTTPDVPEMADTWEHDELVKVLGYNPYSTEG